MSEQIDLFDNNGKAPKPAPVKTPDTVYKTVPMDSKELAERKIKHGTQSADVLAYFTTNKGKKYTAWDVLHALGWAEKRRSSMARVFTNLVTAGLLEKTTETKREQEGVNNYLYTLA